VKKGADVTAAVHVQAHKIYRFIVLGHRLTLHERRSGSSFFVFDCLHAVFLGKTACATPETEASEISAIEHPLSPHGNHQAGRGATGHVSDYRQT
jgi:hypothetical protein